MWFVMQSEKCVSYVDRMDMNVTKMDYTQLNEINRFIFTKLNLIRDLHWCARLRNRNVYDIYIFFLNVIGVEGKSFGKIDAKLVWS